GERGGHADVRAGDRPRHRLGEGPEQAPARDARPPRRRPADRRHGEQVDPQLPRDRRRRLRGRQHGQRRPERLHRLEGRVGHRPGPGGRRGPGLRHRLLDAGLARSGQAHEVRDDVGRRRAGAPRVQRRGLGGPARWRSRGAGAAPQRLDLVQSLLKTPEEFASVPLRTNPDGSVVKVKDVGRTELGTEIPDLKFRFNGKPAGVFAVRQEAGANALETADRIKAKMAELSRFFPPGMKAIFVYDTTPFVKVAIDEVFKTLLEAIFLVFLVMYLFLGNFRATLIPTIAVPVVLLGTS